MTRLNFILPVLACASVCSCVDCKVVAGNPEREAKARLTQCMGTPDKVFIADPGGPFVSETEVWEYAQGSEKIEFWFAMGELQSGPIRTQRLSPSIDEDSRRKYQSRMARD